MHIRTYTNRKVENVCGGFFLLLLVSILRFIVPSTSYAQAISPTSVASQSGIVNVKVTINGFSLSLSGYLAPYASITLTSGGSSFASVVADAQGNFSFTNIKVAKGFSSFCLDGIDYKRLGESESCFTIPPVTTPFSKTQIFLPPTIGVFRENVNIGDKALVFGYGMPHAQIRIILDKQVICQKTADDGGYYECNFAITKEGNHEVYAEASRNGKDSEPQLKRVLIKGIALIKQPTTAPLPGFNPNQLVVPGILIALLLLILLIIFLIIWLRKHPPAWMPRFYLPNPGDVVQHKFAAFFREKKLHHSWMDGVGF